MKVSDLIADFLAEKRAHIFAVSGGANLHILDSLSRKGVKFVCTQTEQAASFAADATCRVGSLGVALATSGPGATNLVTGIASSYYDSVPALYLTGQQSRARLDTQGCRQIGFQQTPIVPMVSHITKYAVTLMKPEMILYELEKALFLAKDARPGPVLVDIPDDLQRLEVEPEDLIRFNPHVTTHYQQALDMQALAPEILAELVKAERPLLIYGWGLRLSGQVEAAQELAFLLQIPVAATWAVRDAFPQGLCFGTHGTKAGNLAVQNADYILSIGSRLDTKATSSPVSLFAPKARLVMVDIDGAELRKMARYERPLYRAVEADCAEFLRHLLPHAREYASLNETQDADGGYVNPWRARIFGWKREHVCEDVPPPRSYFGPYNIVQKLGDMLTGDEIIVSDTGNTLGWLMQAYRFKGERFLHPFNNTPMGYGLPAALAASIATGKRVVCVTGDGSIMMSIGELATIAKHCEDVKIVMLNNWGHSMCRYTQKQWLEGRFAGTYAGRDGDLAFPRDFNQLAASCEIIPFRATHDNFSTAMGELFNGRHNGFLEIMVNPRASLAYQVKFGKPLEDCDPL